VPDQLHFTENDDANRLLASNPTALIIGMLLDQQFPMERAFASPALLEERLGESIKAATIAALDDERLAAIFRGPPALHRFPGSMGTRARDLCARIVDEYDGDTASVWKTATDGADLYQRLRSLPGFGEAKARIFIGVIGKRLEEGPPGWEAEAADWPSIADIERFDQVLELREHKRAAKAARRAATSSDT
jgi:uncharacterized HhH-GPD family protein